MAAEIEYKFLIEDLHMAGSMHAKTSEVIRQGYLTTEASVMVRVRLSHFSDERGEQAWITVKGPTVGMTRQEYEYQIPWQDGIDMMKLCGNRTIEKTRYCISHGDHTIELDIFEGELQGLVMAEIEVKNENEKVVFPEWFGRDVSCDPAYTNASLSLCKTVNYV
jgi:adenylate cyclase